MDRSLISVRMDVATIAWLDSLIPYLGDSRSECLRNALLMTRDLTSAVPKEMLQKRVRYQLEPTGYKPVIHETILDFLDASLRDLRKDQKGHDFALDTAEKRLDRLTKRLYRKSPTSPKPIRPATPNSPTHLYCVAMNPQFVTVTYNQTSQVYTVHDESLGIAISAPSIPSIEAKLEKAMRDLAPLEIEWRQVLPLKDN